MCSAAARMRRQLRAVEVLLVLLWALTAAAPAGRSQFSGSSSRGIAGTVKVKGQATQDRRIEVALLSSDRRPMERVFADSLGAFQFTGLGPGVYIIVIDEPGCQRVEDVVEIPPRSTSLQRRYYLLEPKAAPGPPTDSGTVSARKFQVSKEARQAFEKGERELSKRQYGAAAKYLDRALEIAPDFAEALHARGLVHLQENHLAEARACFEKALSAYPQYGEAAIGLGSALVRQGALTAALEPLTRGLSLRPDSYLGYFERCRANFHLSRLDAAESDCKRARELAEQERPELHILLGNLYLRQGRQHEALSEFETYLRLDPGGPIVEQVRQVVKSLKAAGDEPK